MNLKVAAVNTLARAIHAALWLPAKALDWVVRPPDFKVCEWANQSHLPKDGE